MTPIEIKLLVTSIKQEAVTALVNDRSSELPQIRYLQGYIDCCEKVLVSIKEQEQKELNDHD